MEHVLMVIAILSILLLLIILGGVSIVISRLADMRELNKPAASTGYQPIKSVEEIRVQQLEAQVSLLEAQVERERKLRNNATDHARELTKAISRLLIELGTFDNYSKPSPFDPTGKHRSFKPREFVKDMEIIATAPNPCDPVAQARKRVGLKKIKTKETS